MADKKTELMAQFYVECQKKGYTDMTDSVQSLKAKVIATDLKLNYGNIVSFYEKAKGCYEQVQKEKAEAQKQRQLQQQKEEQERIRRRVDGELLVTLSDSSYESEKATLVRVFIRPDNSVYYTINNGSKIEGVPEISVKQGGAVLLTYHPSQAVYTGATVGGITTGGVHHTKAGYTASKTHSGKGDIEISVSGKTFTLQLVKMTGHTCALFKRDGEFTRLVHNGEIECYVYSEKANLYYETIKTGRLDHQTMMNALSMAADEQRLTYSACECIANLLGRIVYGQFPPSDEQIYESAKALENASTSNQLLRAISEFKKISDYKDAAKRVQTLEAKYEEILQAEKERAIIEKEESKKRNKKTAIILTLGTFVVAAAILAFIQFGLPAIRYNAAERMMENHQFSEAILAFQELGDYKDSKAKITECNTGILDAKFNEAVALMDAEKYDEAISAFEALGEYKASHSKEMINECNYQKAMNLMAQKDYGSAYIILQGISSYKDSSEYLNHIIFVPTRVDRRTNGEKSDYFIINYTNEGKMSDAYRYTAKGETSSVFDFDANGVLVRENWKSGWYYRYEVNDDGTVTSYQKDTQTPSRIFNEFGNVIYYYDEHGQWAEYQSFEYDTYNNRCDNAMNHYDENGMLVAVTYKNGNLRVNSEITYECQYLLESNMDIDLIWRNLRIVCSGAIWYNAS